MWRMGILGCSIQSPHQESVLCGIMWRMGIWVTLFTPSTMMWYSVAYVENRHFGLLYSIPSPGEGVQWHCVEIWHLGYSIQSSHQERLLGGIMWRMGILGYSFQSLHHDGVLSGIMWK